MHAVLLDLQPAPDQIVGVHKVAKKRYAKSKRFLRADSGGRKDTFAGQGADHGETRKAAGRREFRRIHPEAQAATPVIKHSGDRTIHSVKGKPTIGALASGDASQSVVLNIPFAPAGRIRNIVSRGPRQKPVIEEAALAEKLVGEIERQGPDVESLCDVYDLKREELGRLTGFSLRALADWAGGKLPSQPAQRRLHEVRRLLDALSGIVKRESIKTWLHQPNPAFDRLTPLQVIELGKIDRLWSMVYELGHGQPS